MDELLKQIEDKRGILNQAIEEKMDQDTVYKISLELDELIIIYMQDNSSQKLRK